MRGRGRVLHIFLLLPVLASALGCVAGPAGTPFDGARAHADAQTIVEFGPRHPGSTASKATREYIRRQVEPIGLSAHEYSFTAKTPIGPVTMTNVWVEIPGTLPGVIVIGNHYDTKVLPDFRFDGANDGASTNGWMIEFARAIGPRREGHTLWLCWFDGEESYGEWSETDGLYGSKAMVARLQSEGRLRDVRAMINVDMIGDCDLDVHRDTGAPQWLVDAIWDGARRSGHARSFPMYRDISIEDDHTPFREAFIPSIDLIDFRYGGSAVEHQMNWHTTRDRMERVCAESLQAVGDAVLTALPAIDAELAQRTPAG